MRRLTLENRASFAVGLALFGDDGANVVATLCIGEIFWSSVIDVDGVV